MAVIEAYCGEYASGKTEVAINRALSLHKAGRTVTLVDLDLEEPFCSIKSLTGKLESRGLRLLGMRKDEAFGTGEAGCILKYDVKACLKSEGDIIIDLGHGAHGADALKLLEGYEKCSGLRIYAVINTFRPMTANEDLIVSHLRGYRKVNALVSNSHLGTETTLGDIIEGARIAQNAAGMIGIPLCCVYAENKFADRLKEVITDIEIRPLEIIPRKDIW